jgi:uncharacterized protein
MRNLYRVIVGSQSYGTSVEGSDIDYKGVYAQDIDDLIGFNYKAQINSNKDDVSYEIRRFIQLLETANPTVLEMLFSPDDCIVEKDPSFDILIQNRDKFLTKMCLNSFGGYAIAQIKKAKGLDKKMNWEKDKTIRKSPIDFVYAHDNGKTYPLSEYLKNRHLKQENCGLVTLEHFKDCFALYYDKDNRFCYRGLAFEDSNELRLSHIPKYQIPLCIISYNKDIYSRHCKDYKEYNDWLKNRNTQRYIDIEGHNQKIDGKNLLHCRRLLDMAVEIAKNGELNVRRPNADYLIKIRKGQVLLDDIIENAENDIKSLNDLYKNSNLPDNVDKDFVNELLLKIRHQLMKKL